MIDLMITMILIISKNVLMNDWPYDYNDIDNIRECFNDSQCLYCRCLIDARESIGPILNNILSIIMNVCLMLNVVCYVLIWIKLHQVAVQTNMAASTTRQQKYHHTARVMMLFIAAYFCQYFWFSIYALWTISYDPPVAILCLAVLFCNLGGLFNLIAYTLVRRRYQQVQAVVSIDITSR